MTKAASDRLLFVADAAGLQRSDATIKSMRARSAAIDDLPRSDLDSVSALVIDVDLPDMERVKAVKAALSVVPRELPKVFAVDYLRRVELLYANLSGASGLLRRPLTAESVVRHFSPKADDWWAGYLEEPPEVVTASIASAAGALSNMFESLTVGGNLNVPGVDAASTEVADAIDETGFPAWLDVVREHHKGTFQHCLIVTGVLTAFGRSTGMSSKDVTTLSSAGLLHDVGKAAISIDILDKPGRLSEVEMALIREHPARGFEYLVAQGNIGSDVLSGVRSHHEYLDGSGYPDGLTARDIGDVARIVTVCDVYGALVERRSYKPPMQPSEAIAVLYDMAAKGKVERALVMALEGATAAAA